MIPFHKPCIAEEEIAEVLDSLRSGWLTMGPKTVRFERAFGSYVGALHAVAVNSCTAALHLALRAINLQPGDEVVIPDMTFTATGEVVCYFGARPVIVDVERETHNMSPAALEAAITSRTRAVIPVHYGGQPCDLGPIMEIAAARGIRIIEDAAHALPARYGGKMVGDIGDITCFSFYATKTLACGEGGMATTRNGEWADLMARLRLHGISRDAWQRYSDEGSWYYEVTEAGYKYNMTDIQAGLGLAQLGKVEWMWRRRREIAAAYTAAFEGRPELQTPVIRPGRESAWHLYPLKLNLEALTLDRGAFIRELKEKGIGASVHFIPLHRHPFYRDRLGYARRRFPDSDWIYERVVSLPIYPDLGEEQVAAVVEAVGDIVGRHRR